MLIEPQGDRILVELVPYSNDTLVLTHKYKEVQQQAKVVAVGTGLICSGGDMVKPEFEVGDLVLTSQTAGTMIEDDGKKYQLVASEDVTCVLEEE